MSKLKVKNKVYALIIAVTLFVSVNNLSQAEEKRGIIGKELADNTNSATGNEVQNDEISDVKIRYSQEEIDMANQLSDKVKKKKKKRKRKQQETEEEEEITIFLKLRNRQEKI